MRRHLLVLLLVVVLACASPSTARVPPAGPPEPPPEVMMGEARAARESGDLPLARAILERAVRAAPDWDLPRLDLAELLLLEGKDLPQVRTLLEGPVRPENPRGHVLRGQLAELEGDDLAAAAAYAQALLLRADPDVRIRRAFVLERLGRADDAIAELERLRAERADDAAARARLAGLYERAGRLAQAERELEALAAGSGRPGPWRDLAEFHARNGDAAKARWAEANARALEGREERALRPLLPSTK
ncbi:MAG TPA: tetratricopeptide repeat protein [Anaeromyxobacteraceae bacterium]|nr:tetratricopeptide repeat protein [Anaeromyxobacteraceae bacterium]